MAFATTLVFSTNNGGVISLTFKNGEDPVDITGSTVTFTISGTDFYQEFIPSTPEEGRCAIGFSSSTFANFRHGMYDAYITIEDGTPTLLPMYLNSDETLYDLGDYANSVIIDTAVSDVCISNSGAVPSLIPKNTGGAYYELRTQSTPILLVPDENGEFTYSTVGPVGTSYIGQVAFYKGDKYASDLRDTLVDMERAPRGAGRIYFGYPDDPTGLNKWVDVENADYFPALGYMIADVTAKSNGADGFGTGRIVQVIFEPRQSSVPANEFRFPDGTDATSIVTSFNGETGDVFGVSSINGQTGDVTLTDLVGVNTFSGFSGDVAVGVTTGQILFHGTTDITGSNDLLWDNDTGILDIGLGGYLHGNHVGRNVLLIKAQQAISKGDPVVITGSVGGSDRVTVRKANASSAFMPAAAVSAQDLAVNEEGYGVIVGKLDYDTTGLIANTSLYVADGGGLTATRPVGAENQIQKIARVARPNDSNGYIIVAGAYRTNDVPNALIVYDYIQFPDGFTADTMVSSVNGLTGAVTIAGGGGTLDSQQPYITDDYIYLFDDFVGAGADWLRFGTSGSFWRDPYQFSNDDFTGALKYQTSANAYARGIIQMSDIYSSSSDGDEWLFQIRVKMKPNASSSIMSMNLTAFCPKSDLGDQTTEQGLQYGDTAKAGIIVEQNQTYVRYGYYDNEGTNGGPVMTNTTTTTAMDTWYVLGVHAKKTTLFTLPTWEINTYLDGVKQNASPMYLLSGTNQPCPYFSFNNNGDAFVNYGLVDWVSFQYKRNDNVSNLLDITNL